MAEELKTVLGFEASGAIATLNKLTVSINGYNMAMFRSTVLAKEYNKTAKGVNTQIKNLDKVTKGAVATEEKLTATSSKARTALRKKEQVLRDVFRRTKDTEKSAKNLILTWQSVIRIFTIQVIHQMISKVTSALKESAAEARKYEIAIAEVQTIAGEVGMTFDKLALQARSAAEAMGEKLEVVVEAQYQLFSNQIGNAVESLMAFNAAQKLSIAAVTPLNDAVSIVTGTLNAYAESATQASLFAAKLFRTVELGRVRIGELSDSLGRVTVMADQLGITLDEVLASIATFTISGLKANEAMTLLSNIQLKLIRPTEGLKDAFSELNIVSAEAGIQAFGFQGFLEQLRKTTKGTASELGELFGRVRATRGALGLTGKAAERYAKNLEKIQSVTEDLLTEKLELIFETNAKQVEVELNRLSVSITEGFGRGMNSLLLKTFEAFGGAKATLKSLALVAFAVGTIFIVLRTKAHLALSTIITQGISAKVAMTGLLTTMRALILTPAGLAIAVGVAVTAIILGFQRAKGAALEFANAWERSTQTALEVSLRSSDIEFKKRKKILTKQLSALQDYNRKAVGLQKEATEKAAAIERRAYTSLNTQLQDRVKSLESFVGSVINVADNLHKKLKVIEEKSRSIKDTLEAFDFKRQTKDLTDIKKIYAIMAKSDELRYNAMRAINRAVTKEDVARAKVLSSQAETYARQALTLADTTKNRTLMAKVEDKVRQNLNSQLTMQETIAKQEKRRTTIAEASLPKLYSQRAAITQMVKDYTKLKTKVGDTNLTEKEHNEVLKKQRKLGAQIQEEFRKLGKQVDLADALDLRDQFDATIKALRDGITGQRMDLTEIIEFDADLIATTLQYTLDEAAKNVQMKIKILTGEPTPVLAAKVLPDILKQLEEEQEIRRQVVEAQATLDTGEIDIKVATEATTQALKDQFNWRDKLGQEMRYALISNKLFLSDQEKTAAIAKLGFEPTIKQIEDLATETQRLVQERAPLDEIVSSLDRLQKISDIFQLGEMPAVATAVDELILKFQAQVEAIEYLGVVEGPGQLEQKINDAGTALENLGIQAANSATTIEGSMGRAITAVNSLKGTIAGVSGGAHSKGGMIYRQGGGFAPRGTDTVPAMLTPGEFVINAKSAARFHSQLVSMNAGIQPVYHQVGGPVTNVGDINITVKGAGSPQQTARETVAAFRREMRRQTSTLN